MIRYKDKFGNVYCFSDSSVGTVSECKKATLQLKDFVFDVTSLGDDKPQIIVRQELIAVKVDEEE